MKSLVGCLCAMALFMHCRAAAESVVKRGNGMTLAEFAQTLQKSGDDNIIRPHVAPLLELAPGAPTKAYITSIATSASPQEQGKTCNLLLTQSTTTAPSVMVLLDSRVEDREMIGRYYKHTTSGKLLLAVDARAQRDDKNKPIRGSGKATTLDVTSPAVQREFKKELDFWLSGKYKKYLKSAANDVPFRGK